MCAWNADGDYFGQTVNRVARLEATAHGGQVVVSGATAELVRGGLPAAVTLRDLGEHRLKDLGRPVSVFQVCVNGLATDFPPLRSLSNPELETNLPEQASSFVGRDRELGEDRELLKTSRLVTLTGPGGSGKTRLACCRWRSNRSTARVMACGSSSWRHWQTRSWSRRRSPTRWACAKTWVYRCSTRSSTRCAVARRWWCSTTAST